MQIIKRLMEYFRNTNPVKSIKDQIGMEVETSFISKKSGKPISVACSQKILKSLPWDCVATKNGLLTTLQTPDGSRIQYELGRQNLELSLAPYPADQVVAKGRGILDQIYKAGEKAGAIPFFGSVLDTKEDLLMIPDERDATWLTLDGRSTLNLLAKCTAVQFTVGTSFRQAPMDLTKLQNALPAFLGNYPQEQLWRQYIAQSTANYRADRYGSQWDITSVEDYCAQLIKHNVVCGTKLIPHDEVENLDINLFLRSVWWYFRLRRYDKNLCIEVRPLPRQNDTALSDQLQFVLDTLS